ncbi:phospholipase D/Transphosphatidylase [Pseudoxanthomonas suwonensis 11-1]|uniref:Cardiolipin synthase B n=1 Tax=Pseudoxanthomonas suwonensis (strain 11-1) TaxID=743721 RepID=E6WW36_PSEUU|nr:cardiolipin synthase ClsB [Pseudoxanthomonas suwonensis]ADV28527.1 phospholipase D/Transphosphatidylase [Pseudoxanthomonas suwonensis 11-1]
MKLRWHKGNSVRLLENGEGFYPRVFEAIEAARSEILLETFILFEDEVGRELQQRLVAAARRGVRVSMLVDGYGTPPFSDGFLAPMAEAGIEVRSFDPGAQPMGIRLKLFRRMHRKLLVIDGATAFVGGINYSADHLLRSGPEAKQDYAVEVRGPVVGDIHRFVLDQGVGDAQGDATAASDAQGAAETAFIVRDNQRHGTDIEQVYREAIRGAKRRIVIANAYFFPSHGFLTDLRGAARRGVDVRLILQGEPDMPSVMMAARTLYRQLIGDGVCIREYCTRPFHGKVAVVDDEWATVGSSNLDPLSLSLNLEANLVVRDRGFNGELSASLEQLWMDHCEEVTLEGLDQRPRWPVPQVLLYHVLRKFPRWAGLLPAHTPRTVTLASGGQAPERAASTLASPGH